MYCCDGCPRVWHGVCLESKGVPAPPVSGEWRGPCCSAQSSSRGTEGPRTSRERSGCKSADGTTPEHTQHQAQGGESGTEVRYRYTNKKSERSPYIAERAKLAHNLTEREILQLQYQNREGATVPYQKSDLRYDTQQGYLQITGGSQLEGGRAPTERRTGTQPRREAKDPWEQEQGGREAHSRIGAHSQEQPGFFLWREAGTQHHTATAAAENQEAGTPNNPHRSAATSTRYKQEDEAQERGQGGLDSTDPRRPTPDQAPTGPGRAFGLGLGQGRANTTFAFLSADLPKYKYLTIVKS